MINLTFGEQVKIVLSRKDMTIKELAEEIEARTGKKMSRQNLTQRLGRDNFQEQDMRMIADILGCSFQLSILGNAEPEKMSEDGEEMPTDRELEKLAEKKERKAAKEEAKKNVERDITVGEFVDMLEETDAEAESEDEEAVQMKLSWEQEGTTAEEVGESAGEEDVLTEESAEPYAEAEDMVEISAEETEALEAEDAEPLPMEEEKTEEPIENPEDTMNASEVEEPVDAEQPVYTEEAAPAEAPVYEEAVSAEPSVYTEVTVPEEQGAVTEEAVYEEEQTDIDSEEAAPVEEPLYEDTSEEKKHSPFSKISKLITPKKEKKSSGWPQDFQPIRRREDIDEDLVNGDVNPYTGHEYQTNSVRMHPHRIGYVQVYDRKDHKWTDMTEWAFLGVEERKKAAMGKEYEPPIYLD